MELLNYPYSPTILSAIILCLVLLIFYLNLLEYDRDLLKEARETEKFIIEELNTDVKVHQYLTVVYETTCDADRATIANNILTNWSHENVEQARNLIIEEYKENLIKQKSLRL